MKSRLAITSPLVLVAVLLLSGVPAQAGPILLDQSFTPALANDVAFWQKDRYAQTLTVGMTGLMTGIDLPISRYDNVTDLIVSIVGTAAGRPDESTTLATATVPALFWPAPGGPDSEAYRHVAFSPFAVTAGLQLAIAVRLGDQDPTDIFYWYRGSDLEDYTSGQSFQWRPADGGWTPMLSPWWRGNDFAFRTYVEQEAPPVSTVPDPGSTLLLFGIALGGLCAWYGRQA